MQSTISKSARIEVLVALRERYQQASKQNKSKILDEFIAVAGCHRKHAIRLLAGFRSVASEVPAVDRRTYDEAVREALVVLWEAADRVCGKRLKAILPQLVTALEKHGHLALDPTVRQRLLAVSPATIDRLLATVRGQAWQRKKRRTPNKPSKQIPIRTFADWNEPLPGFLEVDFVSHGGSSMKGTFLWSLVATDVCSGWTEAVALVARGPRSWRTRKDPFDGVWPEILLWLQGNPEATAKSLLDRLHRERPGQFPEGQLRTLQRRIREWRRVMARELVYACMDGKEASERPLVIGADGKSREQPT